MFRRGSSLPSFDGPDRPSARDEALATLEPWLAAHRRPAWRPTVEKGEPAGERARSKFCGRPWLTAGEAPPGCRECGRPLRLFVQLDLAELPAELAGRHGEGVLQFFYCAGALFGEGDGRPECNGDDGWVPFSDRVSLVRIVPAGELAPAPAAAEPLPPSTIVGWERFDDVPDPEDHDLVGLAASYDVALRTVTLRCAEVGLDVTLGLDDLAVEDIARAAEGDKLGGWPSWVQGREYPACPTCGETMQLVLQLDSQHGGNNVPFMFGDAGIGHITQCPTHLGTVAFGWACS